METVSMEERMTGGADGTSKQERREERDEEKQAVNHGQGRKSARCVKVSRLGRARKAAPAVRRGLQTGPWVGQTPLSMTK